MTRITNRAYVMANRVTYTPKSWIKNDLQIKKRRASNQIYNKTSHG